MDVNDGERLVRARELAGISRRAMARRMGTSPSALARYESGEMTPGLRTYKRAMAAALAPGRRWASLGDLAGAIAWHLRRGDGEWAWRICTEVFDDETSSTSAQTALFASQYPPPTGNSWADAMVAALGEWMCVQRSVAAPLWTLEPRVATPFWFVNSLPAFRRLALAQSPPSFACRGIFLTRRDLTTA